MKFQVTFKTPDAVEESLQDENLSEAQLTKLAGFCSKWIEWGEYIRVEFDTVKGTCKILEV